MEKELLKQDLHDLIVILNSCLYVLTGEFYEDIVEDIVDTLNITDGQKERLYEIFAEIYSTQSLLEESSKLFWEK